MITVPGNEILSTIEPDVLEAYLRKKGWHERGRLYDNAGAIWRRRDESSNEDLEILLPLKKSLGDYAIRIGDALKTLEVVEKRSQLDILSDLLTNVTNVEIQAIVTDIQVSNSSGTVTLIGIVMGNFRKINIELDEPEYTLAIKAYQERLSVVCSGDLIKEGSYFVLKNLHNFVLVGTHYDLATNVTRSTQC